MNNAYTGPLKIRDPHIPNAKFECECHLCNWAYFKWTIDEAEAMLIDHLDTAHINPAPYRPLDKSQMPGR